MSKIEKLLTIEKALNIFLLGALLFLAASGILTWLVLPHSFIKLWVSIFHGLIGALCSVVILWFGYVHFKRTIGFRRPLTLILGFAGWVVCLVFCVTGAMLLYYGRTETDTAVYRTHLTTSFVALLLILGHLIGYYWVVKNKLNPSEQFPSIDRFVQKRIGIFLSTIIMSIGLLTAAAYLLKPTYSSEPLTGNYEYSYGEHPFRPSQTETYHNKFIDSREIVKSAECATCHGAITKEWIDSTHKKAASDPTYVKNINLLASKKGIAATRYCEGCHAPIALLTGALTPGGFHGGQPNTDANREGVNCLSCHGVSNLEHLKGNASYRFEGSNAYLFENAENSLFRAINRLSIRQSPQQHIADMGRPITHKSEFCASCHAQFMDKDMNNWGWVKMQDDYSAWLNGPYSTQNPRFNISSPIPCQSCHMPEVSLNDPSANSLGKVKSHRFVAANTLTAMLSDDDTQLKHTIRFLQANKIRVTIDKPNRDTATQNYSALEVQKRDLITAPYYFYLNEQASLNIIVSNVGVGHNFPGGTIDINEAWIELVITDSAGKLIYSSGRLNDKQEVDPMAYFYRSTPVDRSGKDVWRHDLFNMIGDRYRNSIPPGGADVTSYTFTIPSWAISPIQVSAAVKYRKLNKKYSSWALDKAEITLPVIDMARDNLSIPLKDEPDVR